MENVASEQQKSAWENLTIMLRRYPYFGNYSLSEDLELLKGSLLREFLVTSVMLKFLGDIISSFAKPLEDTM